MTRRILGFYREPAVGTPEQPLAGYGPDARCATDWDDKPLDPRSVALHEAFASLGVRLYPLPGLWTEAHRNGRVIARWRYLEQLIEQLRTGEVLDMPDGIPAGEG